MCLCSFELFVIAKWQNELYPQRGVVIKALSDFLCFLKILLLGFNEIKERKKRVKTVGDRKGK